jgi:small subunit ribosomal protein S1
MQQPPNTEFVIDTDVDFATLLEESFKKGMPERGDIVTGTILAIDQHGLLVDVGLKKDGMVTKQDLERLPKELEFGLGQDITVMIHRLADSNGNLIVSVSQALQVTDWQDAEKIMEDDEVWDGTVAEANRGGLIVPFGNLRGFIPASHVIDLPRNVSEQDRKNYLTDFVGKPITVKIIEVNRKRRRLVFSQREAVREQRSAIKEQLMGELKEGEVRTGVVSGLRDFGAFVDLGGADGLIHISELAWHRVRHPREVVTVGDKVEVFIMQLDHNDNRIGLSLKRLKENPWAQIDDLYHIGQLVVGEVSRVAQYGAFVRLEPGIEALLHSSQIQESTFTTDIETLIEPGQQLLLRIISIEAERQRLGLSFKDVTYSELQTYAEKEGIDPETLTLDLETFINAQSTVEEEIVDDIVLDEPEQDEPSIEDEIPVESALEVGEVDSLAEA